MKLKRNLTSYSSHCSSDWAAQVLQIAGMVEVYKMVEIKCGKWTEEIQDEPLFILKYVKDEN